MLGREKFNPRILVWGAGERVAPLLNRLGNLPVIWGYDMRQTTPPTFSGETVWGDRLSYLDGSNGQFTARLGSGQEISAGTVALFPDIPEIKLPNLVPGQVLAMFLMGVNRGLFARALEIALNWAGSHQIYIITDDVQVAYPGGEDQYKAARAAGINFFRTSDYSVKNCSSQGYEIELPRLNIDIQADQILDYRLTTVADTWRQAFKLGSLSVSGVLNTRREGICVFPDAAQTAPQEEPLLYDALAARLRANSQGKVNYYPGISVKSADCALCLTCYRICPHQAISLAAGEPISNLYHMAALINPVACRGCGTCVAVCPAGAISWTGQPAEAGCILACENSGWDNGRDKNSPIQLFPCAGAISNTDILRALADNQRVTIYACREGGCRHPGCAPQLQARLNYIRTISEQLGINADINLVRKSAAEIGGGGNNP